MARRRYPGMDSIPHGRDLTEYAMTAESIAKALDGPKVGSGWMARCPAHNDREPSLSISAGDEGIDFYYAIETWQPRLDRDLSREDARANRKRYPNREIIGALIERAVDGSNAGIA